MEAQFWHDKWQKQQIGFHQSQINPFLIRFWSKVYAQKGQVFVPLCGKSSDMCFLAELGHKVLGCELNQIAVEQFFEENQLAVKQNSMGEHLHFASDQVDIIQGDIFNLSTCTTANMAAFYDRAALIAWPDEMRQAYALKMAALVPAKTQGLLITLDYPQDTIKGPPFAVSPDWIAQYLSPYFDVELLACEDVLADNPKFVNKQVPWLNEAAYKLVRNSNPV